MLDLVLVNMPFADRRRPSFALSQLAALVRAEFPSEVRPKVVYPNHDFVQFFGADMYDAIAGDLQHHVSGVGEWIFRSVAFPTEPDNQEEYFARYYAGPAAVRFREQVLERRSRLGEFCSSLIDKYALADAHIVGFSSMFAQTVPSLALAREIKERCPSVLTVMGGANCEAPMGRALAEYATQLDFIFSGPALRTFPDYIRCVLDGEPQRAHAIRGVLSHKNHAEPGFRSAIGRERDIDEYVEPDYDSFVESFNSMLEASPGELVEPMLFFETSRGCWWGERAHCTFCGLNGQTMAYRSMAAQNALAQFERLFRYAPWCRKYFCTDNIMPLEYLTDVVPHLSPPSDVSIFYEVKANLDQADMAAMAKARINEIQPGIEALSTPTLKLMRKGTSAFQNIQFLKNCVKFDITPVWNLLIGFPGEPESTFEKYVDDFPSLFHLPPPQGVFPVRFDRYSPYFNEAASYGLDLQPVDHYRLTYPFPPEALQDLAYYFTDRGAAQYAVDAAVWYPSLSALTAEWLRRWSEGAVPPALRLSGGVGGWRILDSRFGAVETYELDDGTAELLLHLDRPIRLDRLVDRFGDDGAISRRLDVLRSRRLLFEENDRAMNLVMSDCSDDPAPRLRRPGPAQRRYLPIAEVAKLGPAPVGPR